MGLEICGLNLNAARREQKTHGTLEFPCAGFREQYESGTEDHIPWHWHDDLEVIYIESGVLEVRIPSAIYMLSAGDCLAVNAGVLHSAAAKPACRLCSLVFSPLLITGNSDTVYAKKYLSPLLSCSAFQAYQFDPDTDRNAVADFKEAFSSLAKDKPGYEFTVRNKLSVLCYSLFRIFEPLIASGELAPDQDNMRIRKMLDFVEQNFAETITLEQIAGAADIGERECLRCFNRTIRLSPMQYLLKYRIMQGAEMCLLHPADSVSDIAIRCGFDSPSYFTKIFKRFMGCTPREYRHSKTAGSEADTKPVS